MRSLAAAPLLVSALVGGLAPAQTRGAAALRVDDFRAGAVDVDGRSYPYRLLEPLPELAHAPRPLVVFLHGAGERGDDNERQLTWLPAVLGRRELRERLPCYLLAVQCPQDERWVETPWGEAVSEPLAPAPSPALRAVMVAMDRIVATRRVDRGRVYVTGLSMGGYGTWDLAARLPDRFAAALPVCGGGDERSAGRLAGLPISVWHGGADKVVPVARSRVMVATLRALGVPVDYRELDGVGHDAWKRAYGDDGALPWLFAQDQRQQGRGSFASWAVVPQPSGAAGERGRFVVGKDAACVADAGARAAGELFCRALVLETGRRLELRGVAAASQPGDVEFRLAADAAVPVEIAIGDRMVVTARDVEAARRGAAAALQALCTWPDLCCPCGRFDVAMPAGGRVIVGGGSLAWSGAQAMRLVRVAWLFG
ncbi:MAG: dienelactone hydrolase family protein, partial [Planctomycetes bacterium]|nr:dienelactone hydrolase family protein [Planctomycetota bacterium]